MPLHSAHIGNRCLQPIHKSQTTSHSIVSTLTFEKSPLGVPFRRGVSLAFRGCTRRLVQSGMVSAAGATMETTDAKTRIQQLDATDTMHWEEDQELVDLAIVWALQHGLIVGAGASDKPLAVMHAPLTVLPTPFPEKSFRKAVGSMKAFNTLIDNVACDDEYLQTTLRPAAEYDEFTAKLLDIHRKTQAVRQQRRGEQLVLALNRSDYMLDEPSNTLLQVELNTISSSFGCLCTKMREWHWWVLKRQQATQQVLDRIPENDVITEYADGMAAAVGEYNRFHNLHHHQSIILFVVQPNDRNSHDQQWLQTTLWDRHEMKCVRRTLAQLHEEAAISPSGQLCIPAHPDKPVALVYFRAGYTPTDYPTAAEWDIRERLEGCDAALCPSVPYQLAGAKKVQQDLARPGVLECFVDNQDDMADIQSCFAGLWGLDDLDDPETAAVVQQAIDEPDRFVLKPQREGGGNNLYGEAARDKLQTKKGLSAYILMQRIRPPINRALMVRDGQLVDTDSLSELGIFGFLVRRGDKVISNKQSGHMIRTKAANVDEGGVAAGFSVLDTPLLTD